MRFAPISLALAIAAAASALPSPDYDDGYQTVTSATQPVQVRLSYQGPTAMTVSFNTFAQIANPTVRFGLLPFALLRTASSTQSFTHPTSLTYTNHVNLTGLLPDTLYYYLPVGSNSTQPYSFRTPKLAGDMREYTAAVIVDMGTFGALGLSDHVGTGAANPLRPGEQTTIQSLSQHLDEFDLLIHPGDLAYADYWLKEELQGYLPSTPKNNYSIVYEHINNAFYDELANITSYKPYMVSPGNHEANCDNGGTTDKATGTKYTASICPIGQTNFTGYRNRFRMPSGPSGGLENFWYSYDNGMVHYISLDTETDLGHSLTGPDEGSPEFSGPFGLMNQQLNWLQNDLANVDRSKTPWIVVLGHRPFYNSAGGICTNCSAAFEPLFYQYGVDLYFSGHSHVYNRNAPIFNGTVDAAELNNPKATWYIVNGAAGHYDGLDKLTYPLMNYTRYAQDNAYSWSKLIFHNCTHMTVQAIASENGTVYDEATLFKDRTCDPLAIIGL